jgi:gamma-glutamyltranspeptidase/glutathione hydrolase
MAAGWRLRLRPSIAAAAVLALGATNAIVAQPPAAPVRASTQLVVSANSHASEAGREILRAGGGAVDAAIAVQLVLTLVEPQSSGVGGGAFSAER